MGSDIPRPEHPRPQFQRPDWLNLNGTWEFCDDPGDSGLERGLVGKPLSGRITVPFCRESALSGIGDTDRVLAVWYRRTITIPAGWAGRTAWLHIQAADYDTTVWCDGVEVGRHRGGFTPMSFPLPAQPGATAIITIRCRDDWRTRQPRGKQSQLPGNYGCWYTRTTGIWQTVWLEALPTAHLGRPRLLPDVAACCLRVTAPVAAGRGLTVHACLRDAQGVVVEVAGRVGQAAVQLELPIPAERQRQWSPEDPHLYPLRLELRDGDRVVDALDSYAGFREVAIDGHRLLLNGRPRFQRLVLDQGYYPDGVLTAPSDAALVRDIELARTAGFDGARLHQKVFEERYLYHADRLGFLVWGEQADWGQHQEYAQPVNDPWGSTFVLGWIEALERDLSHPSIVGWCPVNESGPGRRDRIDPVEDGTRALYQLTRLVDPTRPVIDASGWTHRVERADVYDIHDYQQDPAKLAANVLAVLEGKPAHAWESEPGRPGNVAFAGQPLLVSEFGGAFWNPADPAGWGYGTAPKTPEEFLSRFAGLCRALLANPRVAGYCYTQLTDVHQERNGVYAFDRTTKFDPARLAAAQRVTAAIEG